MSTTITKKVKAKKSEWVEIFITHGKRKFCLQIQPKGKFCFLEYFDRYALDQKIFYVKEE